MKLLVVGMERKQGNFIAKDTNQQVDYDNTIIYGVGVREGVKGQFVAEFKVKTERAVSLGVDVGDVIVADVDRKYGKVLDLDIVKKGDSN